MTPSYTTQVAERMQDQAAQLQKSILVYAQTLSKRGEKKTKEFIAARQWVGVQVRARRALNESYGRKRGG